MQYTVYKVVKKAEPNGRLCDVWRSTGTAWAYKWQVLYRIGQRSVPIPGSRLFAFRRLKDAVRYATSPSVYGTVVLRGHTTQPVIWAAGSITMQHTRWGTFWKLWTTYMKGNPPPGISGEHYSTPTPPGTCFIEDFIPEEVIQYEELR